jgi:hypothetical protein
LPSAWASSSISVGGIDDHQARPRPWSRHHPVIGHRVVPTGEHEVKRAVAGAIRSF